MRFQPTLPVRGATPGGRCWSDVSPFQPTLPVRGATAWAPTTTQRSLISTHAPRAGSDRPPAGWSPSGSYFNPRSPCGERQAAHAAGKWPDGFQPTLPVRGATSRPYNSTRRYLYFNPRSPCGERLCRPRKAPSCVDFNPRSPCGERPPPPSPFPASASISTHAPRAGSDQTPGRGPELGRISTHAPRAGSDSSPPFALVGQRNFNPRSPCGERRGLPCDPGQHDPISTHAPRAGSDVTRLSSSAISPNFNPRSPCGERLETLTPLMLDAIFQPTLPVRGATRGDGDGEDGGAISTHAPRAGSDTCLCLCQTKKLDFNPRSPCGERLMGASKQP